MEMLIVVVIILIILSIGTNTYQNQRRFARYNNSISEVLSMIKLAQTHAITSRSVEDLNMDPSIYTPEGGYGIYFERSDTPGQSRVLLFANTAIGNTEAETATMHQQYDEGLDLVEMEYFLDENVDFKSLLDSKDPMNPIGSDTAVVVFTPPLADSTLAINNNPLPENLVSLNHLFLEFRQLESLDDIPSKFIHINAVSGVAEISN